MKLETGFQDELNLFSYAFASPTLMQAATTAAKRTTNPMKKEILKGRKTVYDTWISNFPNRLASQPDAPYMPIPTGGSDHAPFIDYLGIPVIDFDYRNVTWKDNYPLYHTLYETHFLNEKILDTNNFAVNTVLIRKLRLLKYFIL